MSSRSVLHAWVDESMHAPQESMRDGVYLLAAAVAAPAACDGLRTALREFAPAQTRRVHWKDVDRGGRRSLAAAIAGLEVRHTVVVGTPLDPKKQERARRKCMIHLLHILAGLGVAQVWAEQRTPSLNRRDLQLINALRSQQAIPADLHVDFAQPLQEPMLWIPDVVAGALGAHLRGSDSTPYEALRARIVEHQVRVT